MSHRPKSTVVRACAALTGLALAASLSACQKTNATMRVSADDRATGTLTLTLSDEFWAIAAAADPDADGDTNEPAVGTPMEAAAYAAVVLEQSINEDASDLPATIEAVPYSAGGYSGVKMTFDNASFKEVNKAASTNEGDPLMSLRRVNSKTIKFTMPVPSWSDEDIEMSQGMPEPTYRATMTFPGKVVSTNGKVRGKTVSWNAKPTAKNKILFAVATSRR